jgi:hypothetical protein
VSDADLREAYERLKADPPSGDLWALVCAATASDVELETPGRRELQDMAVVFLAGLVSIEARKRGEP